MQKLLKNANFYLFLGLGIMALLFYSSSQTYAEQSQIELLKTLFSRQPFHDFLSGISFNYGGEEQSIAAQGYYSFIEFFIRKGAHFMTYFLLGGSFCLALYCKQKNYWWASFFAWLAATGYAGIDEFHQMLTGGRTPLFQDVMLDSAGALTAVLLLGIFLLIQKRSF
ncbi:MAG: VanZ family protein [Enterococcus sp.]